jgi:hypothetical protein
MVGIMGRRRGRENNGPKRAKALPSPLFSLSLYLSPHFLLFGHIAESEPKDKKGGKISLANINLLGNASRLSFSPLISAHFPFILFVPENKRKGR